MCFNQVILVNVQCFFPQQVLNNDNKKKYGERCVCVCFKEKQSQFVF